jgi:glutamate synthase (NADPH/NADH) small chain
MGASRWEQDLATSRGVTIRDRLRPVRIEADAKGVAVQLEYTRSGPAGPEGTGEITTLPADQVLVAIGQVLDGAPNGLASERGRIAVDAGGRTSTPGVWAAGDCTNRGDDLTVTAVAQGRDAAESIHALISAQGERRRARG